MKTSILLTSVGAGLGALGGGGLLVHNLLKKDQKETVTVHNELTKKGHEFLSFEKDQDLVKWKEIGKAYASSTKNRLGSLNITKPQDTKPITDDEAKSLQKACKDLVNNSDFKNADLLSAEQWCVKPITIEKLISKNRKVLTLDKSKDSEPEAWNKKVEDYLKPEAQNKLPNATLLKATTPTNQKTDRDKLRDDCTKAKDKKTYDEDFHDNYTPFNEWCTIPKKVNG